VCLPVLPIDTVTCVPVGGLRGLGHWRGRHDPTLYSDIGAHTSPFFLLTLHIVHAAEHPPPISSLKPQHSTPRPLHRQLSDLHSFYIAFFPSSLPPRHIPLWTSPYLKFASSPPNKWTPNLLICSTRPRYHKILDRKRSTLLRADISKPAHSSPSLTPSIPIIYLRD